MSSFCLDQVTSGISDMDFKAAYFGLRQVRLVLWIAVVVCIVCVSRPTEAQFLDGPLEGNAPRLGDARTQQYRVGIIIAASGGNLRDIYATMPIPGEWPEQDVKKISEETSREVRSLRYRTLPTGVSQMIIEIPSLQAGAKAQAIVTFELTRSAILPPEETASLLIPKKMERELRLFLNPSPYIESRHPRIKKLAKTSTEGLAGWEKVEKIYDTVRDTVEYRNGELKGAARALADGWGDCEELTCLFIAMCRSEGIPARTVWVEGHCYPEFYLEDSKGNGVWFPCQAAGTRAFGEMPDQLP
ncbi:MAG: transglutaminase-like domain-containing protein, partial [Pirellulales bacterium]